MVKEQKLRTLNALKIPIQHEFIISVCGLEQKPAKDHTFIFLSLTLISLLRSERLSLI